MLLRRLPLVFVALSQVLVWNASSPAQIELAARVPSGANTIILLDIDKMMASPIAKKENWRGERENAAAAGLTILPPSAKSFVMAAKMDLEFMQPIWSVSLATVNYEASMPEVAAKWQGEVDTISGRSTAKLPDDSYVVKFGPKRVGAMRPANRQDVARWLKETGSSGGNRLSPYIDNAINNYSKKLGTDIVMAIDMENFLSPELVKSRFERFESLAGKDLDLDQVSQAVSSLRGVTLGLNVKDYVAGAIVVDFDQDVSSLEGIAKPVLLEILANQSAMIDEFSDWKEEIKGKRIRLSGRLYPSGLRRVLSVLDTPASLQEFAPSPGELPDEASVALLSSQQYFHSITDLINDLKLKPKKASASGNTTTSGQVGMWYQKYAQKIDGLPMLNVDPVLLDYGRYISGSFRDAGSSLRDVGGRSRVREMNAPPQYRSFGRWGSGGYYGGGWARGVSVESPRLDAQNRARIRTEERVQGASSARGIMQEVEDATADVRRQMVEKFGAEF